MKTTTIKKDKKFRSISVELLKIIFIVYIIVSIVVALIHFVAEYYHTKESITDELSLTLEAFEPVISKAILDKNETQLNLISKDIIQITIVSGIDIYDKNSDKLINEMFVKNYKQELKRVIVYKKDIFYKVRNSSKYIATITFYSSDRVVFEKVKFGFLLLILTLLVKSLILILLYLYLFKKYLTKPLQSIISDIEKIDLQDDKSKLITYHSEKNCELSNLKDTFNNMIIKNQEQAKLIHTQSRLAQMGEMLSMIAHQWRQPLAAISSTAAALNIEIVLNNYEKKSFEKKIKDISNYSSHLSSTIDDFRNFFKTDKDKEEFLFSDIAKSALNIMSSSVKNNNISLKTEFNCRQKIYSYPNEFKQVVLNLIKNAEDILLEKGIKNPTIWIRTYEKNDSCFLEVADNGGGIPDSIMDKIFVPYFTTKEKKDGTGLGLYMSKIIVCDHCKGDLTAYNSDQGAVFEIKIRRENRE